MYEWPIQERIWLLKYGITEREVKYYGLVYSPTDRRIICPVYRDNNLVMYTGRSIHGNPKWQHTRGYGVSVYCSNLDTGNSRYCTLVEDYISYIKTSRYSDTVALFGTSLRPEIGDVIKAKRYEKYFVFLDHDNWQVKVSENKLRRALEPFGEVKVIRIGKDPKECSDGELHEIYL